MSNAAATVLMVPIAIDIALELGANPQSFVLAVVIGASTSFLTPVGHQSNMLVFGPGGYRFADFTRVSWLLNGFGRGRASSDSFILASLPINRFLCKNVKCIEMNIFVFINARIGSKVPCG